MTGQGGSGWGNQAAMVSGSEGGVLGLESVRVQVFTWMKIIMEAIQKNVEKVQNGESALKIKKSTMQNVDFFKGGGGRLSVFSQIQMTEIWSGIW